jgi:hypothetical protein
MLMIDTHRFIISERTYVLARTGSPWHSKQMKGIPALMGKYFYAFRHSLYVICFGYFVITQNTDRNVYFSVLWTVRIDAAGRSAWKAHYSSPTSPARYLAVDDRKRRHDWSFILLSGFEPDTAVSSKIEVSWDVTTSRLEGIKPSETSISIYQSIRYNVPQAQSFSFYHWIWSTNLLTRII